jgi:hypothetical protein
VSRFRTRPRAKFVNGSKSKSTQVSLHEMDPPPPDGADALLPDCAEAVTAMLTVVAALFTVPSFATTVKA